MIAWSAALLVAVAVATPPDAGRLSVLPPCDAATDARVVPDRQVHVALYAGTDVPLEQARSAVAAAEAWWSRHGVTVALSPATRVPFAAALTGRDALATTPGFRRWLGRDAADADVIDVVVLPTVAAPGSAATRVLTHLDGLTLRPIDLADGDAQALARALDLPAEMRATVLLGLDGWRRRRPGDADVLAAHELGHALGLTHTTRPGNLMRPGPHRCVPALAPAQAEALAAP
ncbi:MAG: matrixin family metalloprotease [Deltaproteobacteria bacterium]|nr:MAG: matrixin family metalloprotease [Deltaproteobacteria bacterium]